MEKQKAEDYLKQVVHPILEKLVIDLLVNRPVDPLEYMLEWVSERVKPEKEGKLEKVESHHTISSTDLDVADLPPPIKKANRAGRHSVSAEAFGAFNKKKEFKPLVFPKTPEQVSRIEKIIAKSFIFNSLDPAELKIVIDAMQERRYQPKEWVIKQNDDGEELYIVESGQLDCFKEFTKGAEKTYLKTYVPGESFGELSLLYSVPRQASIQAKVSCVLWSLDRSTFCNIVQSSVVTRREKYDQFLRKVKLFKGMDPYDISKLGETLKQVHFEADEFVCKEGDQGNEMYLVEQGSLVALKQINGKPKDVFEYSTGDYFGELALLKRVPRQASIRAKTKCTLLCITKEVFDRLIGDRNPQIMENLSKYEGLATK